MAALDRRTALLAAAALAVIVTGILLYIFLRGDDGDDADPPKSVDDTPGSSLECFQLRLTLSLDLPGLTNEERAQIVSQLNDDSYLDGAMIKKDTPPMNFKRWDIPDENVAAPAFIASTEDGHAVALVQDLAYAGRRVSTGWSSTRK